MSARPETFRARTVLPASLQPVCLCDPCPPLASESEVAQELPSGLHIGFSLSCVSFSRNVETVAGGAAATAAPAEPNDSARP